MWIPSKQVYYVDPYIMQVYNITPYMQFHPGGAAQLRRGAGRDSTALFNKYHAWVNAEMTMEKCLVGMLAREEVPLESELSSRGLA